MKSHQISVNIIKYQQLSPNIIKFSLNTSNSRYYRPLYMSTSNYIP